MHVLLILLILISFFFNFCLKMLMSASSAGAIGTPAVTTLRDHLPVSADPVSMVTASTALQVSLI